MATIDRLQRGCRVGPYEIVSELGEGGMGIVYEALDPRLSRRVAIKLITTGEEDPDRLRRFEQEARAAARLSHPNIVQVHDVGFHDGQPYVVAERLEGETLRARLARGGLSVARAVEIATAIARGLAAAHDSGIVHRDVKPDNVFVTEDGQVKILDFGLVKLVEREGAPSPLPNVTRAARPYIDSATTPGLVVGTLGYMAPEQLLGDPVDARADIFAFGAVLYEMLSGTRAFPGSTMLEAANLTVSEPPRALLQLAPDTPPALVTLVDRCLEKSPRDRFQSIRDVAIVLELVGQPVSLVRPSLLTAAPPRRTFGPGALVGIVAGAAVLLGAGAGLSWLLTKPAPLPSFQQVTFRKGTVYSARFAPDGRTAVYSAAWDGRQKEMFVLDLGNADARSINVSSSDVAEVLANGEVAVIRRPENTFLPGMLSLVPLSGGPSRNLVDGVTWADYASEANGIVVVRPTGGRTRVECPPGKTIYETSDDVTYLRRSPDGAHVAFLETRVAGSEEGSVVVIDKAGKRRALTTGWASIEGLGWRSPGEIWFSATKKGLQAALWSVDLSGNLRLLVKAPGRLVVHDVSAGGMALAERNQARANLKVLREGEAEERDLSFHDWSAVADLSPDGKQVLFFEAGEGAAGSPQVYLRPIDGSTPLRLGPGRALALSPDGKWAAAATAGERERIELLPTGAGQPQSLDVGPLRVIELALFFPGGDRLLIQGSEEGKPSSLYLQDVRRGPPKPFPSAGLRMSHGALSPDGRLVAARRQDVLLLVSTDSGEGRPVPGAGPKDEVLGWHSDGRRLYVRASSTNPPVRIELLDTQTGERTVWKELMPRDQTGLLGIYRIRVSSDGSTCAYIAPTLLSDLYLIEGVSRSR